MHRQKHRPPAGYVEAGETPAEAAAREVREVLGIETLVGSLLVVDWAPHPDEGYKLLFVFDGGTLTAQRLAAIRLQPDEIASYSVYDLAETDNVADQRLAPRVAAAFDARQASYPAYLEHGVPHNG